MPHWITSYARNPREQRHTQKEAGVSTSATACSTPPPSIYILSKSAHALNMAMELQTTTSLQSVSTSALLDSGATRMFINHAFVQKHKLETQSQSTMSTELQMRMDPSWRRSRSYSDTANTWRRCTSQSQTLGSRPSSSDICGSPTTTQRLTGLTRVSPCPDAPLLRMTKWRYSRGWQSRTGGCDLCHVHTPWVGGTQHQGNSHPIIVTSPGGPGSQRELTPQGYGAGSISQFQRCLLQGSLWQAPSMESLGPHNWPHNQSWTPLLLNIPPVPCWAEGAWWLPPQKPWEWPHLPIQIPYGGPCVLC